MKRIQSLLEGAEMELLDIVDEKEIRQERQCRGRWHTVRESGTARRTCGFFADAAA